MRSPKSLLVVAGVLVVAGLAIARIDTPGETWFGCVGAAVPSSFFMVTTRSAVGYLVVWLGTMLLAGVGGYLISERRRRTQN